MAALRSKSFFFLVISGLAIVSLPLIIVLVSSDVLMGRLARQSSQAVYKSVTGSQLSQKLIEHVVNQERRVRQYEVLGDERLLAEVTSIHNEMKFVTESLVELPYTNKEKAKIYIFIELEKNLFTTLVNSTQTTIKESGVLQGFEELNKLSKEIFQTIKGHTHNEIASFQQEVARAKAILFWQGLTIIPLTGLLIFYASQIISRPIKQIDQGIRRLGKGDFGSSIAISGPDDLVSLGKRLDWLREKLVSFEQNKSKFAAHISHELKTPLASIREGNELLADEIAGPINEKQRDIIDILRKNSLHLQGLIENLLGYTMAQAQQSSLNISKFPLDKLVHKILGPYKPTIIKKEIDLEIQVPEMSVSGDEERLATVIDNLLSNAVKYSPLSGEIMLTAELRRNRILIDVIDSGPGIPQEERQHIFNPFFQGTTTCQSPVKGSGLGLAIAKEYTVAHGGDIELITSGERGAHFRLTLPI